MSMSASTAASACPRCASPCERDDIRCAVCAVALALAHGGAARPPVQILRCGACGAALRYSAEHQGLKCAFCASSLELETPTDPIEQADWAVPFVVSPQQAHEVLVAWLGRQGFFTPSDLQRAARVETLRPLWWAAWLVDARTMVSWAADSNAGSGRSDWAPHSGQTRMTFERHAVSASRGLSLDESARLAAHTNVATARPASVEQSGTIIEQFDAQRSAARRIVVSAIEASAVARLQNGTIPGSRFRNVRAAVLLEGLTTHRFLLPAYVLAYRYEGTVYRAIVHGQDASCVFGSVPRSWWKILMVVALVVVGIAVVVAIVAALSR